MNPSIVEIFIIWEVVNTISKIHVRFDELLKEYFKKFFTYV